MSTFKYHKNNEHRYNIYEIPLETVEVKKFYETMPNRFLLITLILTFLLTTLISLGIPKNQNVEPVTLNKHQENKITKLEISQAILEEIIHTNNRGNSLKDFNKKQLKRIVKNVIDKIEQSQNQIQYTKNKDFHVLQLK